MSKQAVNDSKCGSYRKIKSQNFIWSNWEKEIGLVALETVVSKARPGIAELC